MSNARFLKGVKFGGRGGEEIRIRIFSLRRSLFLFLQLLLRMIRLFLQLLLRMIRLLIYKTTYKRRPLIQNEELCLVHEEQPQQPQEQVSLRRSTRERKSMISDAYVIYLQEHDFDIGLKNDPINVTQVKQSSNSHKWIEAWRMTWNP